MPGYAEGRLSYDENPKGILLHHDVIKGGMATWPTLLRVGRFGRSDLPGPLYQICVATNGAVAVITDGRANHAGRGNHPRIESGNRQLVGICFHNAGYQSRIRAFLAGSRVEVYTEAQLDAGLACCVALCERYGIPVDLVMAHQEWSSTGKVDPRGPWYDGGSWNDMNHWRTLVADALNDDTSDEEDDDMATLITRRSGQAGYYEVKAGEPVVAVDAPAPNWPPADARPGGNAIVSSVGRGRDHGKVILVDRNTGQRFGVYDLGGV